MKSANLTDPENPNVKHEVLRSWDYKEEIVLYMAELGVPLRTAEVIAIDNKGAINVCYHNKMHAKRAAAFITENFAGSYKKDNGDWRFAS